MDIHFVSTLTPEDEERLAAVIIETAKGLLSCFPVSYTLRVTATSDKVLEHTQTTSIAPSARLPRNRPAKVQTISVRTPAEDLGTPRDKKNPYTDD
jgi:hypothetical protein